MIVETIVILDIRTEYKVMAVQNFVPFDWGNSEWKKLLPFYEEWLLKLFATAESFDDFETATQYAVMCCMESEQETSQRPDTEIIQIK